MNVCKTEQGLKLSLHDTGEKICRVLKVKGRKETWAPTPGSTPRAGKNATRSHTQEIRAVSFLFSTSRKVPAAEMRPGPSGVMKMPVHAGLCTGEAHGQRAAPPTSHGLRAPFSLPGSEVWQPASLVQVCSPRMDRNAPLGEGLAFLVSTPACRMPPVQDRRSVTHGHHGGPASQCEHLLGTRQCPAVGLLGCLPFSSRDFKELITLMPLIRERDTYSLFWGTWSFCSCCRGQGVRKCFQETRIGFKGQGLEGGAFWGRRIVSEEGTELGEVPVNTGWKGRRP